MKRNEKLGLVEGEKIMIDEERQKALTSDKGLLVDVDAEEFIVVRATDDGTITLESSLSRNYGGPGKFFINGLDVRTAAKKKKSFWKNLWNKIKDAAGAILDAITVPIFGYRCRPDISVDFKGRGISIGILCKEA